MHLKILLLNGNYVRIPCEHDLLPDIQRVCPVLCQTSLLGIIRVVDIRYIRWQIYDSLRVRLLMESPHRHWFYLMEIAAWGHFMGRFGQLETLETSNWRKDGF